MMMSKPKPEATSTSSTTTDSTSTVPKSDAIADLERRLADLSASTPQMPVATNPPAPVAVAPTTTAPAAPGNKNALLARIIAAQERAKQAQGATAPAPVAPAPAPVAPSSSFDFLSAPVMQPPPMSAPTMPPPSFESMLMTPAPPMFAAPPVDTAPPAFDDSFFNAPATSQPPPPAFDPSLLPSPQMPSAPSHHISYASAPSFEDLLMDDPPNHHHHPPAMLPPPVPPPSSAGAELDDAALQAILGIEGLSPAEKQELINEQLKIMKSIEDSKKSAQVSAADAFEQRSFSAAVSAVGGGRTKPSSSSAVLGMERTHQAIADGTAVIVQCTSCGEWMQVTGAAQFMMCSSCNTMTQVVPDAGMTSEEAQQMIADAKLAEQLQKEEYENADRAAAASNRTSASRTSTTAAAPASAKAASSGTWMEWLGFGTPAPAPAARTDNLQLTYSRDSADDNTDGLLGSPASQRRAGRVVTQQPLFACVTDSINSAANYAINTAQGIHEDEEGNVHGVDSSSLLAVTQVGRGSSNQSYEQMPGGGNDRM